MSERERLPDRRPAATVTVRHVQNDGNEMNFVVTFGFDDSAHIREAFAHAAKTGSDLAAILSDSCIALSLLLQRGYSLDDLAHSFGENRAEGEMHGLPSSLLGSIVRSGIALERSILNIVPS